MKTMNILRPAFIYYLLFTVLFIGSLTSCTSEDLSSINVVGLSSNQTMPADKVEVAYFHRSKRCETCIYAEERITYIINTYYQNELSSGKLVFGVYNVTEKQNQAIMQKFGAFGSQLFVNAIRNGVDNIKYIQEIWNWGVIDNEQVFDKTVKDIINRSLYGY